MPGADRERALDHVVVVMFENRSFDNLLGRLYQPGEVQSFEGVLGKTLTNPIPAWAEDAAGRGPIAYGVTANMNTPDPDPGEEYPHVNTQLFGTINPPGNCCKHLADIVAPYNLPNDPTCRPTMDGFVADYISAFTVGQGRQPRYDEYAQIMQGYTSAQMPVVSSLARGFATFDHWFAEVPSQTFTNRAFFHAGTASGFVNNIPPVDAFPMHNDAETLFERLEAAGLSWRVYCDPPSHLSFTAIIHARRLVDRFATHFFTLDQFLEDAAQGHLPTYAFIEPNMWFGHNDMHPPNGALPHGVAWDPPSSLLGGDALLATIYDAVRTSSSPTGSNYLNTLLLVVFDEHGGTYDHVPPPAVPAPHPSAPPGQYGFTFTRAGVRLPAIAISAWIPARTVVTDVYRHTSVIRTMRERWPLGPALTARDATAPDLAGVLTLGTPRAQEDWPVVVPQPVPIFNASLVAPGVLLHPLGSAVLRGALALCKHAGRPVPDLALDAVLTHEVATQMLHEVSSHMFPLLRPPVAG